MAELFTPVEEAGGAGTEARLYCRDLSRHPSVCRLPCKVCKQNCNPDLWDKAEAAASTPVIRIVGIEKMVRITPQWAVFVQEKQVNTGLEKLLDALKIRRSYQQALAQAEEKITDAKLLLIWKVVLPHVVESTRRLIGKLPGIAGVRLVSGTVQVLLRDFEARLEFKKQGGVDVQITGELRFAPRYVDGKVKTQTPEGTRIGLPHLQMNNEDRASRLCLGAQGQALYEAEMRGGEPAVAILAVLTQLRKLSNAGFVSNEEWYFGEEEGDDDVARCEICEEAVEGGCECSFQDCQVCGDEIRDRDSYYRNLVLRMGNYHRGCETVCWACGMRKLRVDTPCFHGCRLGETTCPVCGLAFGRGVAGQGVRVANRDHLGEVVHRACSRMCFCGGRLFGYEAACIHEVCICGEQVRDDLYEVVPYENGLGEITAPVHTRCIARCPLCGDNAFPKSLCLRCERGIRSLWWEEQIAQEGVRVARQDAGEREDAR